MASNPKTNYVVTAVECQLCQEMQTLHLRPRTRAGQMSNQTIKCVKCGVEFNVFVLGTIIDGPFGSNI